MKKCIAFVPDRKSAEIWHPCRFRRRSRSFFCRRHELAFAGVLLGISAARVPAMQKDCGVLSLSDMPVASRKPS